MNLSGAGLFQHADQVCNGGSPYDGIIDQDDILPFDCVFQHAQFQADAGFPFFLGGFDESSANIAVFIKGNSKRNTGLGGKSLGGGNTGVRNANHQIRFGRIRLCQSCAGPKSGIVDGNTVQRAVQARKVDILEDAVGM